MQLDHQLLKQLVEILDSNEVRIPWRRDHTGRPVVESVIGLFKNQAIGKRSPFITGPLKTIADVEEITLDWVDRYNNDRLHSLLGNVPPEEYERN
jgi:transposase InsO family protein